MFLYVDDSVVYVLSHAGDHVGLFYVGRSPLPSAGPADSILNLLLPLAL